MASTMHAAASSKRHGSAPPPVAGVDRPGADACDPRASGHPPPGEVDSVSGAGSPVLSRCSTVFVSTDHDQDPAHRRMLGSVGVGDLTGT
jgi:hypothetical protein